MHRSPRSRRGPVSLLIGWFLTAFSPVVTAEVTAPIGFYLQEGDPVAYRQLSTTQSDWFQPGATVNWSTAPGGFGPRSLHPQVSTLLNFSVIHLRHTFAVGDLPADLTLSLKHPSGALQVYLNGTLVISKTANDLPAPGANGFRGYDLSGSLHLLLPGQSNLLALRVEGNHATPLLHGTPASSTRPGIVVSPGTARLLEDGPATSFTVIRTPGYRPEWVDLSPANQDLVILRDGQPVPLQATATGARFLTTFPAGVNQLTYEIIAAPDSHAEVEESFTLQPDQAETPPVRFLVPRNDTAVTRNSPSGEGSLHQAIENAGRIPGIDTIRFLDDEGIPFSQAPVTLDLGAGTTTRFSIAEGLIVEGPPSPGQVTLRASGAKIFSATGGNSVPGSFPLTFRRLVFRDADLPVSTVRFSGDLLVEECEFIGNKTALELYSLVTPAVVRNCLVTSSTTRAILVSGSSVGLDPIVRNCTFTGNPGQSTISTSSTPGVILDSCTFAANGSYAVSGRARATNCLFSGPASGFYLTNPNSFDQGGNLFSEKSPSGFTLHPLSRAGTAASPLDPLLRPLADNGGFTRTMALDPASPAIDLGLPPTAGTLPHDQRGPGFPREVGLGQDAGAFELQLATDDLLIGAVTDASYDATSGLYFQLVIVHNLSPFMVSGFRLLLDGLPPGVTVFNGSGGPYLDLSGDFDPYTFRMVVIQYAADSPSLRIDPDLSVEFLPGSDLPALAAEPLAITGFAIPSVGAFELDFAATPGTSYRIERKSGNGPWTTASPPILAESRRIRWTDQDPDGPDAPKSRFYRVVSDE